MPLFVAKSPLYRGKDGSLKWENYHFLVCLREIAKPLKTCVIDAGSLGKIKIHRSLDTVSAPSACAFCRMTCNHSSGR